MENESQDNKINDLRIENIFGTFKVLNYVPTGKPVKFSDQVIIYTKDTDYRLYWFDTNAGVWHYVTATA